MDAIHNKAVIALSLAGVGGYQFLDLGTMTLATPFASKAPASSFGSNISEDILIDPIRNRILSAGENNNYELVNVATTTSPAFFENAISVSPTPAFGLDSSGEDCSTGIALATVEDSFSSATRVYIADLIQATFTSGAPAGTWTAPSQVQTLTESSLTFGASGIAVAPNTNTGVVTGEFGGNNITAIALPATSGSGTPAITDWVTCSIGGSFVTGRDPHTVTAYQSPNSGHAIALLANTGATMLAVVDLTNMLNAAIVPRTVGTGLGHACASSPLPGSVVSFINLPSGTGTITIVKNTNLDGTYNFSISGPTSASPSITTSGGTGTVSVTVTVGTYNVSETGGAGVLISSDCGGGPTTGVVVGDGATVTCTFNNTVIF